MKEWSILNRKAYTRIISAIVAVAMVLGLQSSWAFYASDDPVGASGNQQTAQQVVQAQGGQINAMGRSVSLFGNKQPRYDMSATLTAEGGGSSVGPGKAVELTIDFKFPQDVTPQQHNNSLIDAPYYIYIKENIFTEISTAGASGIQYFNPPVTNNNSLQVFSNADTLKNIVTDGEQKAGYIKLQVKFDDSAAHKTAYGSEVLLSASMKIRLTLESTIITDTQLDELIVGSDGGGEIHFDFDGTVDPGTPEPPANDDAVPTVTKSILGIIDSTGAVKESKAPAVGDYVVFKINIHNYNSKNNVILNSIVEKPGTSYEMCYSGRQVPANIMNTIKTKINPFPEKAKTTGINDWDDWQGFWSLGSSSGQYKRDFSPAVKIPSNGDFDAYAVAKVLSTTDLKNIATVNYGPGPGPGKDKESNKTEQKKPYYDLALQVSVNKIKSPDGIEVTSASKDDIVEFKIKTSNQGTETSATRGIYLYVPSSFELDNTSNDWTECTGVPADWVILGQNHWDELKIYYREDTTALLPGDEKHYDVTAKVIKTLDKDKQWLNSIGAEIGYFTGAGGAGSEGQRGTDLSVLPTYNPNNGTNFCDVDSFPDGNPFNDFLGNNIAGGYQWVNDSAPDSNMKITDSKENTSRTDQNVRASVTATLPHADAYDSNAEDDFDFCTVTVLESKLETGEKFEKKRLSKADALKELGSMMHWKEKAKFDQEYTYIPDDGYINKQKTFVVYELWVNKSGVDIADLSKLTVTDELPKGLKLYSFIHPDDNKKRYTFKPTKYISRHYGEAIDYNNTISSNIYYVGSGYNNYVPSPSATHGKFGADFAVNDVTENGVVYKDRSFYMEIETSKSTEPAGSVYKAEKASYRILLLCVSDDTVTSYLPQEGLANSAELKAISETVTATEDTKFYWDGFGTSSFAKKFAVKSDGTIYDTDEFQVVVPNAGKGSVDYRIRVKGAITSSGSGNIGANKILVIDTFDSNVESVDVKRIEGKKHSGALTDPANTVWDSSTGELKSPVDISSGDYKVICEAPTAGNMNLKIFNDKVISQNEQYDTYFTVNYKNIKYGVPLKNIAGTVVYTAVPLRLDINKVDSVSSAKLSGSEFKAYYYEAGKSLNQLKEANSYTANGTGDNIINDSKSLLLMPEGYSPYSSGNKEWKIVLVETKAPSGYEKYFNKDVWYIVTVKSDSDNVLSVTDIEKKVISGTSPSDVKMTFDTDTNTGAVTFTATNKSETSAPALYLLKVDQNNKAISAEATFVIKNKDTSQTYTLKTKGDQGKSDVIQLPYGNYSIEETSTPSGYTGAVKGEFKLEDDGSGKMAISWIGAAGADIKLSSKENVAIITAKNSKAGSSSSSSNPSGGGGGGGSSSRDRDSSSSSSSNLSSSSSSIVPPTTPERSPSRDNPNRDSSYVPIGDSPVPLANMPNFTNIFDDGVPLAALPQTGGSGFAMSAMIFGGALAAAAIVIYRNKKNK